MIELTELEQLERAVLDTKAAFDVAVDANDAAWGTADAWDYAADAEDVAWDAWVKAKQELRNYLKEQDNG